MVDASEAPPANAPIAIEIPQKTAELLVTLAQDLGLRTPGEVVMQALGVLQTLRRARASGQRLLLRDPETGVEIDLAI